MLFGLHIFVVRSFHHFCTYNNKISNQWNRHETSPFIVQLVFKLERNYHKGRGSILNALSWDTFVVTVVGPYNLTGESRGEHWSIKSSHNSLSSRKLCLFIHSESSNWTTRG